MARKLSHSAVLHFFLLIQITTSSVKWDTASPELLTDAYSPYELCVLQLTPGTYNITKSIFDQPSCEHLIDNFLENLPKRCWLGGLHQPHDEGLCIGNKMKGDVSRARKCTHLSEKKSLWSSWKAVDATSGLPSTKSHQLIREMHGNCRVQYQKNPGYATAVMQGAIDNSFEVIAFAGTATSSTMRDQFRKFISTQ